MGEVEVPALRGISIDINQGEFVAIIGASGSGKSTMMNMVGCLDTPTKGNIYLKYYDITKLTESDLSSMRGKILGFNARKDAQVIRAQVPLSEMFGYATSMRSMTQGRAIYTMQFSHYFELSKAKADEMLNKNIFGKVS